MKRILFIFSFVLLSCQMVFADAVYDSKGSVISGKIEGVSAGLIQIKNNGNLVTLIRKEPSSVYKDSVEARVRLISGQKIKYSGTILFADNSFVKILCQDAKVVIPRYRVNNIEMFIP